MTDQWTHECTDRHKQTDMDGNHDTSKTDDNASGTK